MSRLLSLNSYHYRRGGSDAVYFDHAKLFDDLGWENAYFSMHHPKNVETPWSKYFVEELELSHDYSMLQKISMSAKAVYSLEAQRKLKMVIEEFQPNIAHAHCIYHHLSPSVMPVLKKADVPVVMTAHDLKIACPAYKMMNSSGICERCKSGNYLHLLKHKCLHNSLAVSGLVMVEAYFNRMLKSYRNNLSKIVTPSRFFKDKLVEWGWPQEMIVYIPNFIHYDGYTPDYNPGDYFLFFGRLAEEKGADTLIRASAKSGCKVKFAGTGPEEDNLRKLAESLDANVEFKGFCSGDTLHDLVRGCRSVILASQWYENAPISILEAYAFGKTVIGANIGGIPEMIVNDETGFLFDSGDMDQLADQMSQVNALPDSKLIDMGKYAREYVEKTYSKENYLDKTLELYSELGVSSLSAEHSSSQA